MKKYESAFKPTKRAEKVLRTGNILGEGESSTQLIERIVATFSDVDLLFTKDPQSSQKYIDELGDALDHGRIVMSTPILTNAGRYLEKPLSACAVVPVEVIEGNEDLLKQEIKVFHEQGMGTGFNLDQTRDPVAMLRFLNQIAQEGSISGKEDRPVGNMAILSVYHPKVVEFINEKRSNQQEKWKFNISINIDDDFMSAVERDTEVELFDRSKIKANILFNAICESACECADPGVVFLSRMNARNPVPLLGDYKTTAPCAEVGLTQGETCQFGYINLGKCLSLTENGFKIDFRLIEQTTCLLTRSLDNALELNREKLTSLTSRNIVSQKRKIGIGLCGVADMITMLGLSYDSAKAREVVADVLAFINFISKLKSRELAEQRGSCLAMHHTLGNKYFDEISILTELYADKKSSTVSSQDWTNLGREIKKDKRLRNIVTIALPPTGRSALVVDASTGVEPFFSRELINSSVRQIQDKVADNMKQTELIQYLAVAKDIHPLGHLAMVAALQDFTDEAVSKTINMPSNTTQREVREVYIEAYKKGLSGVTIYVDQSHISQPVKL